MFLRQERHALRQRRVFRPRRVVLDLPTLLRARRPGRADHFLVRAVVGQWSKGVKDAPRPTRTRRATSSTMHGRQHQGPLHLRHVPRRASRPEYMIKFRRRRSTATRRRPAGAPPLPAQPGGGIGRPIPPPPPPFLSRHAALLAVRSLRDTPRARSRCTPSVRVTSDTKRTYVQTRTRRASLRRRARRSANLEKGSPRGRRISLKRQKQCHG